MGQTALQKADRGNVISMIRHLASDLTARSTWASLAGLTFGGKRDLYKALGYPRKITTQEYRERYNRGDISARIVEAFPKATWASGVELVEDEDPKTVTAFEEDFEALQDRLQVWSMISRADILAGLGQFAVLLIGAEGKTEDELPRMSSQEDILYLVPYGPEETYVDTWENDPQSERFGLPLMYTIRRVTRATSGTRAPQTQTFRVHWTRIIHIADGLLDDRTYGTARLERVWNRLDDLDKVIGGGSEAFWLRVNQGTQFDVGPDVKMDPDAIQKTKDQAEEFAHNLRRTLVTRGITMNQKGSDVSTFNNQVMSIVSILSGATGIPQRILLGSERGELASTQDKENWNERVDDRRRTYGEPIVRQFVDRLIEHGALPEPEEYSVRWPDIKALTQQEQATVASTWAGLNTRAGGTVVTPAEIRDRILGLDELEEEDDPALTEESGDVDPFAEDEDETDEDDDDEDNEDEDA